jgi:2-dehydro-3-deoxyphosphogluconate aldolase/(4S)-4-hydroxy-2-oxoglutarate aldolase
MVTKILEHIYRSGVVSIIRGIPEQWIGQTVSALETGGITSVEITMDTPGALRMIEHVKTAFGEKMLVGAGTVLDPETARLALLSGADFVLSPTLAVKVIEVCQRYSKLAIPGVLTPTEILTAWEAGALLVKVFPARTLGPEYLKDIKGPLPQVELMPVGGVGAENASEFIRCGAHSLGVGGQLVNPSRVRDGRFEEITQKAAELAGLVREARK